MNGEERQLITGLFDRLRGVDPGQKDRDAENLINQSMRQNPDAAYLLVQTNLVQEHALEQAGQRIQDLEQRVRDLEEEINRQPQQSSGGSFLGGLFGGSTLPPSPRQTPRSGSVPSVGARPMGSPQGGSGSPWGTAPGYGTSGPGPQQQYGAPPPYGAPQQAQGGGGGFMRSALTTAAGVAGGMLVANTISNMMGGGHAHAAGIPGASGGSDILPGPQPNQTSYAADSNDPGTYDDTRQDADQDADDAQDADDDNDNDQGFSGGGDDGSTDA